MSKIDWSKASEATSDPARVSRDANEFKAFGPTAAGRKEFAQAKKIRSAAAKQAAATRKANREREVQNRILAQEDEVARKHRDKTFFMKIQANLSKRNELRNQKSKNSKPSTASLGTILKDAFDKFSNR